jgi:dihydrofolate synthase / folylpolyglutamate synthase
VGMGGRLDATNTVFPLLTIITTITLEHQEFLGNTLKKIALEKAGIIKNGVPLVSGVTQQGIQDLYKNICRAKNVPFFLAGREFKTRKAEPAKFSYFGLADAGSGRGKPSGIRHPASLIPELKGRKPDPKERSRHWELRDIDLGLLGDHQIKNAGLALTAVRLLQAEGFPVTERKIRDGLKKVFWPARMEILSQEPLVILDGAHNRGAMKILAEGLRENFLYQRFFLIIGIMKDKDIRGVMSQIVPLADFVFLTRAEYERSAEPEVLKTHLGETQVACRLFTGIPQAMDQALQEAGPEDLICITGSLFVAGEARAYWEQGLKKPFFTRSTTK